MRYLVITALFILCGNPNLYGQQHTTSDSTMITIFLKHQQDKNLSEIKEKLRQSGFWQSFPPKSSRVVSWYVMMGIGQVVTLKLPPSDLRTLNLSIEKGAWGAFDTEFYPTYDFHAIWQDQQQQQKKKE